MAYLILVILHIKFPIIQLTIHSILIIIALGSIALIVIIIRYSTSFGIKTMFVLKLPWLSSKLQFILSLSPLICLFKLSNQIVRRGPNNKSQVETWAERMSGERI